MRKYKVPGWILCGDALVLLKGCPGVGFGLESAFSSVQLALESGFCVVCFRRPGMWRKRIDVDI